MKKRRWADGDTFQASQAPLGLILFDSDDQEFEGLFALMRSLPRYVAILSVLRQDPSYTAFRNVSGNPSIEIVNYAETPRLVLNGDFQQYWAERNKNLKHNFERQSRRAREQGNTLELVTERHPARVMQAETYSVLFNVRGVNWPISLLSRWIMNHSNVMSIITRRRENYQILLSKLSSTVGVRPLFAELPADVCPRVFPVVFTNIRDAHLQLRRRGIPAVTWGGVRHPGVPKNAFPEADLLYDNLVLLPVHQCLTDKDSLTISRMVIDLCTN